MTDSPPRPAHAPARALTAFLALTIGVALTSCQVFSRSDQPGTSKPSAPRAVSASPSAVPGGLPAPTSASIASVVDYVLPAELGVFLDPTAPPSGGYSIAVDDVTNDLYFLGVPLDRDSGRPTRDSPNGVYHFDVTNRTTTKIAGLSLGVDAQLIGLVATAGWVMWGEYLESSAGTEKSRKRCLASKADGSQPTTLLDRTGSGDSAVALSGCDLAAGGGTAVWFDDPDGAAQAYLFDTTTATTKPLGEVVVPGGSINADALVLAGDGTAVLLHPSTGQRSTLAETADAAAIGASGVVWLTQTETSSTAMGCALDPTNAAAECAGPVKLGSWPERLAEGSGLVGVAGSYAVINPPTADGTATLINLTDPTDQVVLPGGNRNYAVGGKRLVDAWSIRVAGDNSDKIPRAAIYLRVITLV